MAGIALAIVLIWATTKWFAPRTSGAEETAKPTSATATLEEKVAEAEKRLKEREEAEAKAKAEAEKEAKLEARLAEIQKKLGEPVESQPAPTALAPGHLTEEPVSAPAPSNVLPRLQSATSTSTGAPSPAETPTTPESVPGTTVPSGAPMPGISSPVQSEPAGMDVANWVAGAKRAMDKIAKLSETSAKVTIETHGMPVSVKSLNIGQDAVAREFAEDRAMDAEKSLQELEAEQAVDEAKRRAELSRLTKELAEAREELSTAKKNVLPAGMVSMQEHERLQGEVGKLEQRVISLETSLAKVKAGGTADLSPNSTSSSTHARRPVCW